MLERSGSDVHVQSPSNSFVNNTNEASSKPCHVDNHHSNGNAPAISNHPSTYDTNVESSGASKQQPAMNRYSLDNNRYAGYQGHPACLADTTRLNNSLLSVEASSRLEPVPQEFSSRREIVELLDSELLLDYLVQNGVLTLHDVEEIHAEPDTSRQNLALLKHIEVRPTARQLFTNVLRQTGQHYLANLVDDSARIKVLSGSGYLSKSRHKGEVGVVISIKSMKLAQDSFRTVAAMLHKDWISLEDIQMKISSLKRHHSQRSIAMDNKPGSSALLLSNSDVPLPPIDEIDDDRVCCFCCCCQPSAKQRRDKYSGDTSNDLIIANNANFNANIVQGSCEQVSLVVTCQPRGSLTSCSQEFVTSTNGGGGAPRKATDQRVSELRMREVRDNSVENLRSVADSIQARSQQLYAILSDTSSQTHSRLLRYFEQDRGVLVLGAEAGNDGLGVLCICTKLEHVLRLRDDLQSTKLTTDLERVISSADVLEALEVLGLKLGVQVNTDDLDAVRQELH